MESGDEVSLTATDPTSEDCRFTEETSSLRSAYSLSHLVQPLKPRDLSGMVKKTEQTCFDMGGFADIFKGVWTNGNSNKIVRDKL